MLLQQQQNDTLNTCYCVIVLLQQQQNDTWNTTWTRTKDQSTYILCWMINKSFFLLLMLFLLFLSQNYKITHEKCQKAVLHVVSLTFIVRCKVSLTYTVRHTQVRCIPTRGIWWPRVVVCHVSLTCAVRHTQVRCIPTRGIWWPRAVLHQVSLTCQLDICSQMYPAQMSDDKSSSS